MISFENDYSEGAHPKILERLAVTNLEQTTGYGNDPYCASAKEKIRAACGAPDAEIYFLVGGTQTNQVAAASLLQSYEGVVAASTGHVATHESGAIECSGHKVLTLPEHDGKMDAGDLDALLRAFWADPTYEHTVFPGMVYLSHPTELGTLYRAEELKAISEVCRRYNMPLYLDGARLAYGLMSRDTDVDLPTIAKYCDAFYIGGTKTGALFGEALVFPQGKAPSHFVARMKQRGALLAKGRLLGLQFDTLFTDGLYFEIGAHAIEMAERLKQVFVESGIPFFRQSPTNQQFVVLTNEQVEKLRRQVVFSIWGPVDETHTAVRFVTSWATRPEAIDALRDILA